MEKLHVFFQKKGLKKGDRIVLSTSNDYYTALFFLSFLKYGAVTIFLDPDVPSNRAKPIIKKADVNGFVMDEELFPSRAVKEDNNFFTLKIAKPIQKKGKLFNRLLKNKTETPKVENSTFPSILNTIEEAPLPITNIKNSDLAYVLFTSGTTSDPKGVMINYGNLFAHLQTLTKVYNLDNNTRILNILMLYHVDGIIQGPMLSAYNLATWVNPFKFDLAKIGDLFNAIYKYRITHFIAVPTILSFMNKFSEGYEDSFLTDDFKFIISAAAKLEIRLWKDFEEKFKTQLVNVYGLTESVTGSIFCSVAPFPRKLGTIGVPIDCEAKIINADNKIVNTGEEGNLWLKGPHIFTGYLNNPEATNEILKDGWLNTGDIASIDNDGFYTITGREKNIIISGGINIYPEQVTEIINTHTNIIENICLGVSDEIFGEKLVCALVVKPNESIEKLELIEFLRPLLEQNQIPKEFYFFNDLPKGLSGKIQNKSVLELIQSQDKKEENEIETSYQEIIKSAASEVFGLDLSQITMNDNSNTLEGWDSMGHLFFITHLEKHFGIEFSTAEMMTMHSLATTERILIQKLSI
ncbi:MAG: long-chain acyl-CoA synthetase [Polaribacter sp.]